MGDGQAASLVLAACVASVVLGADKAMAVHNAGGCTYSFQVWTPNQDVMQRLRDLELQSNNISSRTAMELALIRNTIATELLRAQNLTHYMEKSLLEQKLKHVQQTINDLVDVKGENRKLWGAIEQLQGTAVVSALPAGDRGGGGGGQGRQNPGGLKRLETELTTYGDMLGQLKNGVGDLKAEWLLIKREVQDFKSDALQLKFGQNDLKADTVKLKTQLDTLGLDSTQMRNELDDLLIVHDKLKKGLSELKFAAGGQHGSLAGIGSESQSNGGYGSMQAILAEMATKNNHLDFEIKRILDENRQLRKDFRLLVSLGSNLTADDLENVAGKWQGSTSRGTTLPNDCHDIYQSGYRVTGVYQVQPLGLSQLDNVYCEMINNTGWTLIQRRVDGSLSFNRRWLEYKYGFGNLYGEFWLGNEMVHQATKYRSYVLRVDMWDWEGRRAFAEYDDFKVASEEDKYSIRARGYKGNAGDSMSLHDGMAFSTEDADNDRHMRNCAQENKGGWWFRSCYSSHLNGIYHTGWYSKEAQTFADGIAWYTLKESEFYSLKRVEMKMRPYYM